MSAEHRVAAAQGDCIAHSSSTPPVPIPRGHVGEFVIPGTGKRVWWTGRVAIGLRYQPQRCMEPVSRSSQWVQGLLLGGGLAGHKKMHPA